VVCGEEGLEEVEEYGEIHLILGGVGQLECGTIMEKDVRNGERCMYFVWYFRWLKDSSFFCCLIIILSVKGKIVSIV
jgi:hypothetical protein